MTKLWPAAVGLALVLSSFINISPQRSFHASADQTYCNGDLSTLMSQCWKYVQTSKKTPPSAGCCAAMKPVDVPCACAYITKTVEGYVSMDRVVYVARSCGKTLAPGTKCGSYNIPPK